MFGNLRFLFEPDSVAVIGASEKPDKLGYHVMKSLATGKFKGTIVPVNPRSREIMGIQSFPSITEFKGTVDLAIIALPAQMIPEIFEQCIERGVKGIVLITAGFKEIDDPSGAKLQNTLADLVNTAGIPVIGPNTFGMINLHHKLNASFTPEFSWLKPGGVSLVSQSGGISHLFSFIAMREQVGVSKIVGLGNRLNIDFAEMVDYLMEDSDTRVIVLYIEGLDQPRKLMKASRRNWGRKPIIAYKTGAAQMGDSASLSHTGSMAGKQEIYEGALKQAGILCLDSAEGIVDLARTLTIYPPLQGRRVAILSGQAGPSMAACDVCEMGGLEIATFAPHTQRVINKYLPPLALRTNPVDMGPAWYNPSAIRGIVRTVMDDENVDGVLFLMMYASANRKVVTGISDLLLESKNKKPLVACLNAPPGIWDEEVDRLENAEALINFPTPERAARVMAHLWQYKRMMDRSENERSN